MALTKITGQVINNTTDLVVGVTTVGGGLSATDGFFSGIVTFSSDVSVGGTLTYEDVTNIDSVGLITARNGIVVGSGITLSKDGDVFFTGIATGNGSGLTNLPAANLTGALPALDGSALTGVANTAVIFADKISLGDNERINIGLGSDLKLSHDSNNSIISNSTGEFLIQSDILNLRSASGTSHLYIPSTGIVTKAKQPGFTATTNAEYNFSTNVTLTYNNVQTNNGNHYDGTNCYFTAPVDGLYYFSFDYYAQTNNTARAVLKKSTDNGGSYSIFRYGCRVNAPGNYVSATTSGLIALNANDRVLLEREDGIVHINNPYNFFSMFLIG